MGVPDMMEQALFKKRRDAQARQAELEAEIAAIDAEIAGQFTPPELGLARVAMLPADEGGDVRWFTTNLREVVALDVRVAMIQRLDEKSAWAGFQLGDAGRVGLQIVARAKPIRLEITPTEHAGVPYV